MRSLQARLILSIVAASIILSAATGLLLYELTSQSLVREFDRSLLARARALSTLLTIDDQGKLDFEYNEQSMPEFRPGRHAECFVIRYANGRIYAVSGSLASKPPLKLHDDHQIEDVTLPSGQAGRAAQISFIPAYDPEHPVQAGAKRTSAAPMTLLIARSRDDLDDAEADSLGLLAAGTGLLALVLAIVCVLIVRVALRPLRELADDVSRIQPAHLDHRVLARQLPSELEPIARRLNDLLDRLERAFARERRFTSDVAHELRTPIAELRALTDVALRWPDDQPGALQALRDSRDIAVQLQTLVATLLSLVRSEHTPAVARLPMRLAEAVARIADDPSGLERQVELEIDPETMVEAEPVLLASVLRNLLDNAREYAEPGTPIACRAHRRHGQWMLSVENRAPGLSSADLPHLFEPFWRKDSARTGSSHAGLGLSLVRAYCRLMAVDISVHLGPDSMLSMELVFPPGSSSSDHVAHDNVLTPA